MGGRFFWGDVAVFYSFNSTAVLVAPPPSPATLSVNLQGPGGVVGGSMQPVIEANNAESGWSEPYVARGAEVSPRLASGGHCLE